MAETQIELNNNRKKQLQRFKESLPEVAGLIGAQRDEVYKDGALDAKIKRLMAMVLALGSGCVNCVLSQTETAYNLGATREEFLEAISVATSMRGTTGVAESLRVIQFLDELDVL